MEILTAYKAEIEFEARTEGEAGEKMQAISQLLGSMDHADLVGLAQLIEESPEIIQKVKNINAMIQNPPLWLRPILPNLEKMLG